MPRESILVDEPSPEAFLTEVQVAELLSVSRYTVRQWVQSRRIPFYRLGPLKLVRIRLADIQAYLKTSFVPADPVKAKIKEVCNESP
jgi:excisionase family DNA binding protein